MTRSLVAAVFGLVSCVLPSVVSTELSGQELDAIFELDLNEKRLDVSFQREPGFIYWVSVYADSEMRWETRALSLDGMETGTYSVAFALEERRELGRLVRRPYDAWERDFFEGYERWKQVNWSGYNVYIQNRSSPGVGPEEWKLRFWSGEVSRVHNLVTEHETNLEAFADSVGIGGRGIVDKLFRRALETRTFGEGESQAVFDPIYGYPSYVQYLTTLDNERSYHDSVRIGELPLLVEGDELVLPEGVPMEVSRVRVIDSVLYLSIEAMVACLEAENAVNLMRYASRRAEVFSLSEDGYYEIDFFFRVDAPLGECLENRSDSMALELVSVIGEFEKVRERGEGLRLNLYSVIGGVDTFIQEVVLVDLES